MRAQYVAVNISRQLCLVLMTKNYCASQLSTHTSQSTWFIDGMN